MVIIGHRRKYAAIELGLAEVPCWIAENEDEALKIAASFGMVVHRPGKRCDQRTSRTHTSWSTAVTESVLLTKGPRTDGKSSRAPRQDPFHTTANARTPHVRTG